MERFGVVAKSDGARKRKSAFVSLADSVLVLIQFRFRFDSPSAQARQRHDGDIGWAHRHFPFDESGKFRTLAATG
jgi:hypothetical protein